MAKTQKKIRGVYERDKGSGIWWIRYTDADSNEHREKAGAWSTARDLLEERRTSIRRGEKLPELRSRRIQFSMLCDDAISYSRSENGEQHTADLLNRFEKLKAEFGDRPAESIRKQEILDWLTRMTEEREWRPATRNRWQACFSLVFRVGIENEKIQKNPAANIRRKRENNGRVRFLSEQEEDKLVQVIDRRFPEFVPHFMLSLHTGMRMSEQYTLTWDQVDFAMKLVYLEKTKNGDPRAIPLNNVALAALEQLRRRDPGATRRSPVFPSLKADYDAPLQGSRGWFPSAIAEAKIEEYTWHCNRHTFASRLAMAGVDLLTVAHLLGHRTLQMVKRYAHLAPEHQADAVALIGDQSGTKTGTSGFKGKPTGLDIKVIHRKQVA